MVVVGSLVGFQLMSLLLVSRAWQVAGKSQSRILPTLQVD